MTIESLNSRLKDLLPGLLGIHYTEATADLVKARLLVRKDLCTVGDILHGGAIMAFADTLGAVATVLNIPASARTATIESKTNFIRPAPLGTEVTGECTPVHKGRRTMTWQTRVIDRNGKLVALVTQTQMVIE
jgi:1,4-dihydroxy-2-naphthoyl-CoA hydrolase